MEVEGFEAVPMAHSTGPPLQEPSATYAHTESNTRFSIESRGSRMIQSIERGGASAHYEIAYQIGSGIHAAGYLVQIDNHLFQSPLSYYAGYGWGIAPGYEHSEAPNFYRRVTRDCLFCHAGESRPVPGTLNTYLNPPFQAEGITCERCHGPTAAHLRNPVPGSIINPATLPPGARDSVCEQCHLKGEARITNPGIELSDFHAGEDLEKVFTVYVFKSSRNPAQPDALTVISQSQQLALSRCARMSGDKLWCGTCHDPHQTPTHPEAYFRARCLSCHGMALLKTHPRPNQRCIDCHMPRLPVTNGGHTIFTDHRIAVYTAEELAGKAPPAAAARQQTLVPWRNPPAALAGRNLGLAYFTVAEKSHSLPMVKLAYQLLRANGSRFPHDPDVFRAMGEILVGVKDCKDAEALFQKAIQLEPFSALNYYDAALAYQGAGNNSQALASLEKSLQLDPLLQESYRTLAQIYAKEHEPDMVRRTLERYLRAFPKSIEAQRGVQGIGDSTGPAPAGGNEAPRR